MRNPPIGKVVRISTTLYSHILKSRLPNEPIGKALERLAMSRTITVQELHEKVEVLIRDSNGKSYFIQDADGWILEDDDGHVVVDPIPETLTISQGRVVIHDVAYRPYMYEEVEL